MFVIFNCKSFIILFLITGAASGLGKALTNQLLEMGKIVLGLDKDYIDKNLFKNRDNLKTIIYDLHDYDGINKWASGEPNDWGSGEDCGTIRGSLNTEKWNDFHCTNNSLYGVIEIN